MLDFSIMRTKNFQMSKLGLEKAEEPEIKLPTFTDHWLFYPMEYKVHETEDSKYFERQ